ncbi:hypothetical protein FMC13_00250 [Salmonella enterica subsp. enterica serovar Enteritidis]|nr:hypothetical protein [Salmonella enterica subsp. enterica serovar Enteritidis]
MAMKKFSELVTSVTERIASRSNPTGLKAGDLGAYSTAEFNTEMEKYIDIDVTDIEQIGDQSYFPLAIEGSADGAIAMTERRTYGICQEADGSVSILRSASNSMKNGVYYAICKNNGEGLLDTAIGTSRQYNPTALPKIPQSVWCHNHGVMMGVAMDANDENTQPYIVLTNGTFNVEKHVAAMCTGSVEGITDSMARCSTFVYKNKVYLLVWWAYEGKNGLDVHTCMLSDIKNGAAVQFTKETGFSGKIFEGTTKTNLDHILFWEVLNHTAYPSQLTTLIPIRAGVRNYAVVKGNIARIYCTTAWYTNSTVNIADQGTTIWYVDLNLDTKQWTLSPNAGTPSLQVNSDGSVSFRGPCTMSTRDRDYKDGFWVWGGANLTGNMVIREDGLVTSCVNDNLASPMVRSYRIGDYAGNVFDELAKLTPISAYEAGNWINIKDRVVGSCGPHGFVGFTAKNKVYVLSRIPGGQSNFEKRLITADWDLSYRYKNSVVDVMGFPPTSRVHVGGSVSERFATIHMSDDQTIVTGSWLQEGRLSSRVEVDPDTLALKGASISITQAELDRAAKLCWDTYTSPKLERYSVIRGSIVVPPASTGAPCLMFISVYDPVSRKAAIMTSEVTTSAREGNITVTGVITTVTYTLRDQINNIDNTLGAWGPLGYRKCADGWLIAGAMSVRVATPGNANDFQFRGAKNASGAWVGLSVEELYEYLASSGRRYNVHPVWGLGYVDLGEAYRLSNGGQVFRAYGPSVAEYLAGTVKHVYMVSTVVAASGYDIYINEDIACLFAGKAMTLPKGHYNLKDYNSSPGNKTWYVSVVPNGNQLELELTIHKQEDDKGQRVNIGTITTSDTQISVINLNKTTKLGTVTL